MTFLYRAAVLLAVCLPEAHGGEPTVSISRDQGATLVSHLSITGMPNSVRYHLQRSFNLRDWVVIGTVTGSGETVTFNDRTAEDASQAFYRLALAPTPTEEVWIAIRTDGRAGSGTQLDPYDGSTQQKFDAVMHSLGSRQNLAVHLMGAGPFRTHFQHTWYIPSGWVISGDGMYATTVQVVGNVAGIHYSTYVLQSDPNLAIDNVIIRDLTVDCNWPELSTTADTGANGEKNIGSAAVQLCGSNNLLERVRSINSYGSLANKREHFALYLAGPRSGDGVNNVIKDCRAELPRGSYGNPFALSGWSFSEPYHFIVNSKVIGCTAIGVNDGLSHGFNSGGVNLAFIKDCEVDGNTFIDCYGAAYLDVGRIDGLRVTNNIVVRGWEGVGLATVQEKKNITISGNNFQIQNRVFDGSSYGIIIGYGPTNNVTITNNTMTFDALGSGVPDFWGLRLWSVTNVIVADNVIGLAACPLHNEIVGTGITMFNNRTPGGLPVPGLGN